MIIALIAIAAIALTGLCVVATGAAGYCYGDARSKARWIVQQRRNEARLRRDLHHWQEVVLRLRGAGSLTPPRPNTTPVQTKGGKRFVSSSQVVAELKDRIEGRTEATPPSVDAAPTGVPEPIAKEFLREAAPAVNHN